jgi:uncharacterized repeat protein (TIGR01451 family)
MNSFYLKRGLLVLVLFFCTTFLFSQNKISSFPYAENFETGLGDWIQSTDDVFDWTWHSNGTSSSGTGPNAAFDGTYYIYTEASSNFNTETYLDASFDFSGLSFPYLTFYYHMYGNAMGSLHVDIWNGTWNDDVFVLNGQQQTDHSSDWKNTFIDLTSYAGIDSVVVRLRGITGPDWQSDISIDKIEVFEGTDMSYSSSLVNQPIVADISQNSDDNIMAVIEVATDGLTSPLEINSFNLSTTGSDDFSHDVSKVNIFYTQTDSIFSTDSLFGSATDLSSPVSGSIKLSRGKNYFWVTYDITEDATPDNKVDIECSNIAFNGITGDQVPTNVNADRFRSIEPAITYTSSIVNQAIESNLSQNSDDNIMAVIEITADGFSNTLEVNSFNIDSTGSDNFSQDVDKVNIFYTQTDSIFSTDSLFGSATNLSTPISGLVELDPGKNYFWVTYDITEDATPDNKVDIECSNIAFNGITGDQVPTNVNADRFRSIEPAITYTSSIVNQAIESNLSQNSDDNIMAVIEITADGFSNTLEVNSFNIDSTGSDNFSQDVDKVNIFYTQTDSIFSTDSLFGSATNLSTPISGLVELDPGKNYFWVTYDITEDATPDNKVDIECSNIAFNGITGDQIPTNVNADRFRSIEPTMNLLTESCFTASTAEIMQNRTNYEVIGINIQTENSSNPFNVSEIKFKPTGSDDFTNDVSKINVYYTANSAVFNTDSLFGIATTQDTIITGSQELEVGNNYFWIAYDIHSAATIGNKVDAECHYVMVGDVKYFPTDSAPAGNREITEYSKYYNFMPASIVVGQPDFYTQNTTYDKYTGTAYCGSDVSSKGMLAVISQKARILLYNEVPDTNGAPADIILGQPNFNSANYGCSDKDINWLFSCAFSPDGEQLLVSDAGNNRVLIWNAPFNTYKPADIVIGQEDFNTNSAGYSPSKLNVPSGIFVAPDGRLFITDMNNNRVLIYNSIPIANGAEADIVLGQQDMYSNTYGNAANQMCQPTSVSLSPDGKLIVSDPGGSTTQNNNRVLIFNSVPNENGTPADVVIGQPDFGVSNSGCTQTEMYYQFGVTVSPFGELAVGSFGNSRVLIYKQIPDTSGAPADFVLGQPDFDSNAEFNGGISEKSMRRPYEINFDLNGRLFVNGRDMNRLMIYGDLPTDSADVQISIDADKTNPHIGETISYTFTLTNNGPNSSSNIVIKSAIPSLFELVNYTAEKGEYHAFGGTWNIPFIASGESIILTLEGSVKNGSGDITAYSNIVASSAFDGNMNNNASSLITNVINDAPTITVLDNDTIVQGTSTDWIPFTINDIDTEMSNLELVASSSNQAIVPDVNIQINGNSNDRLIKVTPLTDQSGFVDITVTVSDGYNEAQSTFELYILSTNANLTSLDTSGTTITGFRADSLTYTCELPVGTTNAPTVTALAEHLEAQVNIYETDTVPGITTIEVTAEDGISVNSYLVTFVLPINANEDASLIDLKVDGTTIDAFSPIKYTYNKQLSYGTVTVPTISAIPNNDLATLDIRKTSTLPGKDSVIVTAEDGITKLTYVIEYIVQTPSNNNNLQKITIDGSEITSFNPDLLDYVIEYPYGTTDIPTVIGFTKHANASITQTDALVMPGTTTLDIYAEDGTLKTYTVEFTIASPSTDASLVDLKVDGSPIFGFDPDTYSYDIGLEPTITDAPVITASANHDSAVVVITNATSLPGTSTILVTAQDGTTELTYHVNFTYRPLSTNSLLSDLKVDELTIEDFNPEVYSYTFKLAIDEVAPPLTTATKYDTKSTLKITNATEIPGITTVTVTAEDGSTSEYQVNFIYLKSDATLSDIKVDNNGITEFDPATLTYTVELAYGTTEVPTVTTVETDVNANSEITDASELPGTTTILVTAEDGVTTETYEVEFTIADPATDATLSDLQVDATTIADFDAATLSYSVELDYGTTTVPSIIGTATDTNAGVIINDDIELPGKITVEVTAEDGTTSLTYEVDFTIAPNTDATLSDLQVDGETVAEFDPAALSYSIELDYGTTTVPSIIGTATDANAGVIINDDIELPGKITVEVTAEDGSTSLTYEVNFTIAPNTDATLSDLQVDGETVAEFDPTALSYSIELDYGTTTVPTVIGTATDTNAGVIINDDIELPGKITVEVTAEDGTTSLTYEVNFTIAPNTDATLSDLQVDGETVAEFDPAALSYSIELDYGTTTVPSIIGTATDANAGVIINDDIELPGKITVEVTAEDGSTSLTYEVNFTIAPNTDATLSDLQVDDETVAEFDAATLSYNVELNYGTTTVPTVTGTATDANAEVVVTVAIELPGKTTVEVTAEDGTTSKTYNVNFTVTTSINEQNLDGIIELYPNPTNGIINISIDNDKYSEGRLEVFNSISNLVYIEEIQSSDKSIYKIDLSNLPKGIYFVKISNNEETNVKKVIIK